MLHAASRGLATSTDIGQYRIVHFATHTLINNQLPELSGIVLSLVQWVGPLFANDTLRVPPEDPAYSLKRVWLTREEEEGYYYGFANEGLWPLCHITHTRPVFRLEEILRLECVLPPQL